MTFAQRVSSFFSARPTAPRRINSFARDEAIRDLHATSGCTAQVHIPTPDPTSEDRLRDHWQDVGLRLARQEDWPALSDAVRAADAAADLTPGGMAVAELIVSGATLDVVGVVEHAMVDGRPAADAPIMEGIEALETVLNEHAGDYVIALVVARAHIDLAWVWRGENPDATTPRLNRDAFSAHMDRARDILRPFRKQADTAPALLSAICAVSGNSPVELERMITNYSALVAANPLDFRHMRALGTRLLPRWNGSYDMLEREARSMAGQTHDIWGTGGYTWVLFDPAMGDDEVLAGLDVEYFTKGLHDILALRPDQYTVNLLAAFCGIGIGGNSGNDAADYNRSRIQNCTDWIVRDYLTELHPMLWAHAAAGFNQSMRVRCLTQFADSGLTEAQRILKAVFLTELARGQDVHFTSNGPVTELH